MIETIIKEDKFKPINLGNETDLNYIGVKLLDDLKVYELGLYLTEQENNYKKTIEVLGEIVYNQLTKKGAY